MFKSNILVSEKKNLISCNICFIQKIKLLSIPTREWGPALIRHRKLIKDVDGFVTDPWAEKGAYVNPAFNSESELRVSASYVNLHWTNSNHGKQRQTDGLETQEFTAKWIFMTF